MANGQIVSALKPLGIPVYYQQTTQRDNKYIIFSIYNNKDRDHVENSNLSEMYYITLKYYFNDPKDLGLYKEIKKLMKSSGFGFDSGEDLPKDGEYYGKELDFTLDIII